MTVIFLLLQFGKDCLHKLNFDFVASFKETNILPCRLPYVERKINTNK